jgi:hypothetical protein
MIRFLSLSLSLSPYLVSKMGQIIKVQRPVSSASISGLYVTLEVAFTIALLGVLLYKCFMDLRNTN